MNCCGTGADSGQDRTSLHLAPPAQATAEANGSTGLCRPAEATERLASALSGSETERSIMQAHALHLSDAHQPIAETLWCAVNRALWLSVHRHLSLITSRLKDSSHSPTAQ